MANHTIAQFREVLIAPAAISHPGVDGHTMWEYTLDGNAGRTVAATDTVDFWELPANAGVIVQAASVETKIAGTASATMDIQIAPGGTPADVTGLTAWALDATAGTKLVKFATAANVATHTAATTFRIQVNTAGLGAGKWVVRVYGVLAR